MLMEAIEMQRNWKELPPELYRLIFQKLPDISDFIRVRAVCKPWRSSTSVIDLPPQFPCIIMLGRGPDLQFYSIVFDKVYTIHVPCLYNKMLFGHAAGYMLGCQVRKKNRLSLLNPLNNNEIPLPVLRDPHPFWYQPSAAWIGPPNLQCNPYVLYTDRADKLVVCRPGDDRWDILMKSRGMLRYFYLKDLLFMIDKKTKFTKVMDVTSRQVLYIIPPPKDEKVSTAKYRSGPYLVESSGDILRVCCYDYYDRDSCQFDIHRLELRIGEERHCWVKVRSIKDQILFFDFPSGRAFSLSVNDFAALKGNSTNFKNKVRGCTDTSFHDSKYDFAEFKGNCIYFIHTERQKGRSSRSVDDYHSIKMYDIDTGKTICIDSPLRGYVRITWFIPTLKT